ncbi:MAG: ABC transporter permease [Betaproteobacteria bacterium]|jgi:ABC-2 type transport system permease protein|nr:ABC transporter permease subunit [Betaproteobacteria bacterium]
MILTIAAKEIRALFNSPLAWLVLTVVQVILGYGFLKRLDDFLQIQPQLAQLASPPGVTELVAAPTFATAAAVLLFAVPLLAMRLIAEERRNQTMALLLSSPLSMTQIVIGKFAGLMGFLLLLVLITLALPLTLAANTSLDYGLLASLALALLLLAASFAAVSLYTSCLTAQPIAAALLAFGLLLAMLFMGETAGDSLRGRGWQVPAALAQVLSPLRNFEPLGKGMIDSWAIACPLLLTAAFLVLAVRRLDGRRLRG